ncbi:hypothetical protein MUK70_12875 [Dyadobacter chenwenxiniae]|uniref:Uncharacterized protein n=1 Tax=Dyadobacter chenwenxiniae TaxID=2906456 RepID=A0A9X1PIM1_9BACT|nr:hypothetical protein [Dyadobacter chenwenxiniae]MCF0060138.1 hypothetical protein [Dyadobacter chenwenxiniae]UON85875.1 hypothetical protein MUK70_12875 [Dyadobacter chenwenxiniae]
MEKFVLDEDQREALAHHPNFEGKTYRQRRRIIQRWYNNKEREARVVNANGWLMDDLSWTILEILSPYPRPSYLPCKQSKPFNFTN